jgi:hypothetical protein
MICIRVCGCPSALSISLYLLQHPYLHQIHWVHHRVLLYIQSVSRFPFVPRACIPQCQQKPPPACCGTIHNSEGELRSCALSASCPWSSNNAEALLKVFSRHSIRTTTGN